MCVFLAPKLLLLNFFKLIVYILGLCVVDKEIVLQIEHGLLVFLVANHDHGLLPLVLFLLGLGGSRFLLFLLAEELLQVKRKTLKLNPLQSSLSGGQLLAGHIENVDFLLF